VERSLGENNRLRKFLTGLKLGIERIFGGAAAGMKMAELILSLSFSARAPVLVGAVH